MELWQLPIQVLACGITTIDTSWGTREHCDPYWRLYVNKRPGAYLTLGSASYDIEPNRVHLVPAWTPLRCHSAAESEHLFIHFNLVGLSRSIVHDVVPEPVSLATREGFAEIVRSYSGESPSALYDSLHRGFWALGLVCRALDSLCEELSAEKLRRLTAARLDSGRIGPVLRYIDAHLDMPLDNASLARIAHQSRSRFIAEFGRVTGQTPARYVAERRVAAAAEQLAFTVRSIEQIATTVGFANRFYFTRVFAALMGISPARYRRAQQAEQPVRVGG